MPYSSINQSQHVVRDIPSFIPGSLCVWHFHPIRFTPREHLDPSWCHKVHTAEQRKVVKSLFLMLWDKTHVVADLLICLVGVKQQLGLKLLSIPAGSSLNFTEFWAKCMCSTPGPRALASVRCSHHQLHSCEVPSCLWSLLSACWRCGCQACSQLLQLCKAIPCNN